MRNKGDNEMDAELAKQVEGMTASQRKMLASIYVGMADLLMKKRKADSLAKWKRRKDYRRN